jgi:PadR family transcriptional regulator, regulatory protein AphA
MSTTSYVVLAQLAMRPWSAYELAQQRERYFQYMWPGATRVVYTEVKRLAAAGLASTENRSTGKRRQTLYSITKHGRDALQLWLDTPISRLTLEFEALVRIFASPIGTREQLLATLAQVRADVDALLALNNGIRQEYINGTAPFQHEAHVRTLVVDFLTDFADTLDAWVDRTTAEIASWEDLTPNPAKLKRAAERINDSRGGGPGAIPQPPHSATTDRT